MASHSHGKFYRNGQLVDFRRKSRSLCRLHDAWRRNAGETFFPRALNPRYKTWYQARYEQNEALRAMYVSAPPLSGALLLGASSNGL